MRVGLPPDPSMAHTLLTDLVLLMAVSVPVVLLFQRLRLPSLAAYLCVGTLVGPHALGWVAAVDDVEHLAETGVALLLFTVGLEFSVPRLMVLRNRILSAGGGQMLLTIAAVAAAFAAAGHAWRGAALFGFLAALSSTTLVLKGLSERRELSSPHGQLSVGVLLVQDLAVIPLMLAVPVLAGTGSAGVEGLLAAAGKAVLAVTIVLVAARYGFSRVASVVVQRGGRELFVLFVVLVALGAALVTQALALPLALGAFVAGLVISESEYSHQVVSEILPFRDVFSALFFVSCGMLLDVSVIAGEPALVLGLAGGLALLKGGLVGGLTFLQSRSWRTALLTGAALFQIGEFSFVLAQQAGASGLLSELDYQRFLAVAIVTMMATPFVMRSAPGAAAWLESKSARAGGEAPEATDDPCKPRVVVAGYGLSGRHLAGALRAAGVPFRVVEMNPDTVARGRREGLPIVFGDVSRLDGLEHAGVRSAQVLVLTTSDPAATRRAVSLARRIAPRLHVLVRTRYYAETDELLRLGATEVVPEELEASVEVLSRVLRELGVPRAVIGAHAERIRRESYRLLRAPYFDHHDHELIGRILAESAVDSLLVAPDSEADGRTLRELDLRRRTGALVVSIAREGGPCYAPGADEVLRAGDVVVLLGEPEQVEAARAVLESAREIERARLGA